MTVYFLCAVLLTMGLYCLVAKKNIVKKILGMVIIDYAVNLYLIIIGYKHNGLAPIVDRSMMVNGKADPAQLERFVDPLPQALVLTSIVIGLGVLALMVAMCIRLYEKHGTFDMSLISKLKG
jgi:multicomponent Na+:H+ antiporter subunit C